MQAGWMAGWMCNKAAGTCTTHAEGNGRPQEKRPAVPLGICMPWRRRDPPGHTHIWYDTYTEFALHIQVSGRPERTQAPPRISPAARCCCCCLVGLPLAQALQRHGKGLLVTPAKVCLKYMAKRTPPLPSASALSARSSRDRRHSAWNTGWAALPSRPSSASSLCAAQGRRAKKRLHSDDVTGTRVASAGGQGGLCVTHRDTTACEHQRALPPDRRTVA